MTEQKKTEETPSESTYLKRLQDHRKPGPLRDLATLVQNPPRRLPTPKP